MSFDVSADTGADAYSARILLSDDPHGSTILAQLRADPCVEFIDRTSEFASALRALRPAVEPELLAEPTRWAYYPWRRSVVAVPGPNAFRRLRLDRNRNMITLGEQQRLAGLTIGVVGLSVGHAIAHTLAAEGLFGQLRLADFDTLELSNLNRVPATVFDIGVNKAIVAAQRIAELDPYLAVHVLTDGLTPDSIGDFINGLDVVVEECDSLDIKVAVRLEARRRQIPVVMATSDRGLVDVERFDLEPDRPILHGLLGNIDPIALAGLTSSDKVPHVLRILDAAGLSSRAAASLVEVGRTLSTWPQLAGDVAIGAAAAAEVVRRIGLGEPLTSGRVRIDVSRALDAIQSPVLNRQTSKFAAGEQADASTTVVDIVADAAARAPSAGNAQPWRIEPGEHSVTIAIDPAHSSAVDVGFRASAVAVGAAAFNARIAAAAHNMLGTVEFTTTAESPLTAVIQLAGGQDPDLARLYRPMLARETNRRRGTRRRVAAKTAEMLMSAARREGAQLRLITDAAEVESLATIVAATDRARYLTPHLHAEMVGEVRWPGDSAPETGIDVRSLELDAGDLIKLEILKRPDVMAHLATWDAGAALGDASADGIRASSALAIVTVTGHSLIDYARGGAAAEAVWVTATECGLAVHPVSPLFLYAEDERDLNRLSAPFAQSLAVLRNQFRRICGVNHDESPVLAMKLVHAPSATVRSRRRGRDPVRPR